MAIVMAWTNVGILSLFRTQLQNDLALVMNHKDHKVTLSHPDVLGNCLCSTEELQAYIAVSTRPVTGCQGLLISFLFLPFWPRAKLD